jgi:hypothetical protein
MMPAVPQTVADLLARRSARIKARSLHDDVEECHLKLWDNPDYRRFFFNIHSSQTVEGSFISDEHEAARMVRDCAVANDKPIAASAKLAAIVFSLRWVCKKYSMTRRQLQRIEAEGHGDSLNAAAE